MVPQIAKHENIKKRTEDEAKIHTTINSVAVLPNPAKGHVMFQYRNDALNSNTYLNIFDVNGILLISQNIPSNGEYYLDLKNIPEGVYIYQIYTDKSNIGTGKLVVQK